MAEAQVVAAPAGRLTLTERNWTWAVLFVGGLAALFGAVEALEIAAGRTNRATRFVYDAFETSTRTFAIAHILVGTAFLLTSRTMERRSSRLWFGTLAVAGVAFCWLFQAAGGRHAHVPAAVFYAYFFVHEFRDEAWFYRANGDAVGLDDEAARRDVLRLPALALGILLCVFLVGGAWGIGGTRRYGDELLGGWSQGARQALGAAFIALTATVVHLNVLGLRRRHGSVLAFLRMHRPIVVVYAGTFVLIFLGAVFTGRLSFIVALHVAAWYVFATRRLKASAPEAPVAKPGSWRWMRTTQVGFQTLHLGLFAIVVALGLVWAYVYGNDPSNRVLWALVSRDAFPFWTILHVTLSFTPR
ncbi:MAG: hypothetical protein AB7T63_16925 [Planctomycetota bacterium]